MKIAKTLFILTVVLLLGLIIGGVILELPSGFNVRSKTIIWSLFIFIVGSLTLTTVFRKVF
jgi:hypothetical protein